MVEDSEEKKPQDAGAALKAARLRKGLKQEDVAKALRISTRQVSALENNKRDEFPGAVYYRGALQAYCEYLDLDFVTLWRQLNPPPPPPPHPSHTKGEVPTVRGSGEGRRAVLSVPKLAPSLLIPAGIFGGLLFAAGIFWFATQRPPEAPPVRVAPPAKEPAPTEPPRPEAPPPTMPPEKKAGRHILRIEPSDNAWVRLRVDRQLVFEGNMTRGRTQTFDGDQSFGLRTPREGSLQVWLDDEPVDLSAMERDTYGNILIKPVKKPAP